MTNYRKKINEIFLSKHSLLIGIFIRILGYIEVLQPLGFMGEITISIGTIMLIGGIIGLFKNKEKINDISKWAK